MTLKKIVQCRLLAAVAALLTIVPLGTVSAQKAVSTATKKASPQQQSCAARCEALVQEDMADNQEYDLGETPEDFNEYRRKCMSYCPGQPAVRLGNAPGQTPQSSRQVNAPQTTCSLARVWSNQVSDGISSVWTISADGTATEQGRGNAHGHAVLSGRTLTITWGIAISHGNYVVKLNQACTAGIGKTTVLGGISAGDVKNMTFTAVQ
jgi:hypothetical protein